jgi:pimeloyl-ACP methyl ester carboxylesterase
VYTFDLPNHGKNTDFKNQFTFNEYCDYVVDFINKKKIKKIVLFGHSMGGGISQAIYSRLKDNVTKVMLMDPLNIGATKIDANRIKTFLAKEDNLTDKIKSWLSRKSENETCDPITLLKELTDQKTLTYINEGIKDCTCPLLVIFGENDYVVPTNNSIAHFKELFTNNALFTYKIIPDAKHSPDLENYEETFKIINDFLTH